MSISGVDYSSNAVAPVVHFMRPTSASGKLHTKPDMRAAREKCHVRESQHLVQARYKGPVRPTLTIVRDERHASLLCCLFLQLTLPLTASSVSSVN